MPRTQHPVKRLGRPTAQASAETHERLLAVARAAFARDGFDATTNRQLAAAAGITTGAIYHYYPSKAELYAAVYARVQDDVYGAFEAAIVPHQTLVARFSAVLDAAVALNRDDPSIAGFVVGIAGDAQHHPELRELMRGARRTGAGFLRRLVVEAAERGELAPGVSIDAVDDLLTAVLSGLARLSSLTGEAERHACAVDALQRFLAGTLLVPVSRST
jgi:AcrR family transcriptional regulator